MAQHAASNWPLWCRPFSMYNPAAGAKNTNPAHRHANQIGTIMPYKRTLAAYMHYRSRTQDAFCKKLNAEGHQRTKDQLHLL